MMIFNGKKEAERILLDLKRKIKKLKIKPVLATILVGDDKASKLYIRLKKEVALKIGIKLVLYKFKNRTGEENIIRKIDSLNKNEKVHGIIVQLPLPKGLNAKIITGKISCKKDVDGFKEKSDFLPVLPSVILLILKKAVKSSGRKEIIALVNSRIFGETLKGFLKKERIKIKYILRREAPQKKLKARLRSADVIITACGVPNLIKNDMVGKGAVLIDAGISRLSGKKVVGDVDRESVKDKTSFLTPVPGGIGPLTVVLLLKNTYFAAKKHG